MKPISLLASLTVLCLCLGGCSFETEAPDHTSPSISRPSATVSATTDIITSTTTSTTERSTTTTTSTTATTTTTTLTTTTTTTTTTAKIPTTTTTADEHNNVEALVWIPQSGSKYHSKASCSNMKSPSQVSKSEAIQLGYEPCKRCYK